MKPENAIEVHNLEKSFKVYYDKGSTFKEKVLFTKRNRYEVRHVLRGISFEVKKGEAIGLIGHNGCGKSTTLKLLTRIIYPDSGTIEMAGRVASLIELGAGFHPDMSGRENIYINAAIFGLTKKEIDARLNDIIAFSELEEFIDNPVRTYSSGMYMRLAFAVAINVDADILLVDEILAVGDAGFQAKCFNKMREIKGSGTTIVIVSHALNQIEQICDRSIWIHEGVIKAEGLPRDVDPLYMIYMSSRASGNAQAVELARAADAAKGGYNRAEDKNRWGSGEVIMTSVTCYNDKGEDVRAFASNESCNIEIKYNAVYKIEDTVIGLAVYRDDNSHVYGTNTLIDTSEPVVLEGDGTAVLKIIRLPLNEGVYKIDFELHKPDGFDYDFWKEALRITVSNPHQEAGIISLEHEWTID